MTSLYFFIGALLCKLLAAEEELSDRKSSSGEHDLQTAIKIPFEDPQLYFDSGEDGFPAFGIKPGSDIKSPYRLFLPEKLYPEFSIVVTFKLNSMNGGFLFAVVNPLENVVQLGVQLVPSSASAMNVSLLYTDVSRFSSSSNVLATFSVPWKVRKYKRTGFRVTRDGVQLFDRCAAEPQTVAVTRDPTELLFDSASTLYIGQAGPLIKGAFDGAVQEMKIYESPDYADVQCPSLLQQPDDEEKPTNGVDLDNDYTDKPPNLPPPPPSNDNYNYQLQNVKGEKGEPGMKGESIRGLPGPPGPPGSPFTGNISVDDKLIKSGFIGPRGPPGECRCNLTTLFAPGNIPELLPGPPGIPGIDGKMGLTGLPGAVGLSGERGPEGVKGDKGDQGDVGQQGSEGIQGLKGEPGIKGEQGLQGPPGTPGLPGGSDFSNLNPNWKPRPIYKDTIGEDSNVGRPGPPGPKGDPGLNGAPGMKGAKGIQGSKGVRGEPGIKGNKGNKGQTGSTGPQGFKGEQGMRGFDGRPGIPGDNAKGEKGDSGPPGSPGLSGLGPLGVKIDKIKGDKGSKGDHGEKGAVGNTGPGGIPGLPGQTGPKGERGEPGLPAAGINIKGDKGPMGPPGPPGKIRLPADVLQDLLKKLKDLKGEKGEKGTCIKGDKGEAGRDGSPGPPGVSIIEEPKIESRNPDYHAEHLQSNYFSEKPLPIIIVPRALTVQNKKSLTDETVGTIAFVVEEESLLVRVSHGWKYISLGSTISTGTEPNPTSVPTSTRMPPLTSWNLVHPKVLRIAALNEPYTGNMHGVMAMDNSCHLQSQQARLYGTKFKAFLSSRFNNLRNIVHESDRSLPIVNIKGDVLFNSWNDMFAKSGEFISLSPKIYSFNGRHVLTDSSWKHKFVWHGSDESGDNVEDSNCDAWNSGSEGKRGLGSPLESDHGGQPVRLLDQRHTYDCRHALAVLCVETPSHADDNFSRKRRYRERQRRREARDGDGDDGAGHYDEDEDFDVEK